MSFGIDLELPDGQWIGIVEGHTYNLTPMWVKGGVVKSRSREMDGLTSDELGIRASRAVLLAVRYPDRFRALNPENGWGDFDGFLEIIVRTAVICADNPGAIVRWNG